PLRTAVLDIVTRHVGSTKTILKSGGVLDRYRNGDETVPISEAAKRCGLTTQRFRRLAVELEVIPKEWGRGTPLRIERQKAEKLADRLHGNKTLKEIASELGLANLPATAIVHSGLVEI